MWGQQYPQGGGGPVPPHQHQQHRGGPGPSGAGNNGGGQRYQGNKVNHHHNNGQYPASGPNMNPYMYAQHQQQQQHQQGPHMPQYHHQQQHYQQQQQQQHYQQQQAHLHPQQTAPYGMYPLQAMPQHQQPPYGSPYGVAPMSPTQAPPHALHTLSESVSHMSIGSGIESSSTSTAAAYPPSNSGATPPGQIPNGMSYPGQTPSVGGGPEAGMQEVAVGAVPLSPMSSHQIAGPSSVPMGGNGGAAGAVSYGMVPMSPGMMQPMAPVDMGGMPMGVVPMGMGMSSMAMGMGTGHAAHAHAAYPAQSGMMMGIPNRGAAGGAGPGMMQPYQPVPGSHFGPGPGVGPGPPHIYAAGVGPQGPVGPGGAGPSANAGPGAGNINALPLSARFPPLPRRPDLPPTLDPPPPSDAQEDTAEGEKEDRTSQLEEQTVQLRAAVEAYQARDEAWALRMEAIGFEPARAYVAAVSDSNLPPMETARADATPTIEQDGADENDNEKDNALRSAVAKRGFAPVLGLRLLQRIHKLEKENAELHDLLSDQLQIGGPAESSKKEEAGKKEKAGGGGGREAEGAKGLEDRAKATVELLENELQDAHALIAALSTALEAAERKPVEAA
ncbi:hypothetical protein CF319_g5391 [Tilletia indica]|nr:hypothetical protein CF319_g5391 [Tilletia indica]